MIGLHKFLWMTSDPGVMESCYKLYTWIHYTVLMLLLQIFWKMSQFFDYFKEQPTQEKKDISSTPQLAPLMPLTKDYKFKRHIRSMSDVISSTPYHRQPYRPRKGSHPVLSYDSDTRAKRIRQYRLELDSSDSSDSFQRKPVILEHNIMKHSDSMRIL